MLRSVIAFLFYPVALLAQDPDTLLTSILRTENDTECVNQLYTQGFSLIDKNPPLAYHFAENCEKIALRCKSPRHISKSYNLMGILFFKQGNDKKALAYFEKYLSSAKSLNNKLGVAFGLNNIGQIYLHLKQFQKAESYYLQAVDYYNQVHNSIEIANGLINLGVLKHEQKQTDAAYEYYQKALETGKALNNYEIKAICYNNLGQLFADQRDYDKALAYNYDALELRELMGLDVDKSDSYLSIAEIALKQKNTILAEENLNLAKTLCDRLENYEGRILYYKLLSELQSQQNNYQLAYENLLHYNHLNDSLHANQPCEIELVSDENGTRQSATTALSVKNRWLLLILFVFSSLILFILIRNKR